MICPECNSSINDSTIICPECGFEIHSAQELKDYVYIPKWSLDEAKELKGKELSLLINEILSIREQYNQTRIPQKQLQREIDNLIEKAPNHSISPLGIISLVIVTIVCGFLAIDFILFCCLFIVLAVILYIVVIVVDSIIFHKSYEKRRDRYMEEKVKPLQLQLIDLEKESEKMDKQIGVSWATGVIGDKVFYSDHIEKLKTIVESGMANDLKDLLDIWNKTIDELSKISK